MKSKEYLVGTCWLSWEKEFKSKMWMKFYTPSGQAIAKKLAIDHHLEDWLFHEHLKLLGVSLHQECKEGRCGLEDLNLTNKQTNKRMDYLTNLRKNKRTHPHNGLLHKLHFEQFQSFKFSKITLWCFICIISSKRFYLK